MGSMSNTLREMNDTIWGLPHAGLFCVANAAMYVGVMYVIPKSVRSLPRDHVRHMKYRMFAVVIATILSLLFFALLVPMRLLGVNVPTALGFQCRSFLESLLTTALLMAVFYLGPIATLIHFIAISRTHHVAPDGTLMQRTSVPPTVQYMSSEAIPNMVSQLRSVFSGSEQHIWSNLRGLVYAPITEEIVFRAVMIPALYIALVGPAAVPDTVGVTIAGATTNAILATTAVRSPWIVVWVNPLCFGVAHLHHFIEKISTGTKLVNALLTTLVQLTYTSIFGVIATLLFMRTGNIYSATLSHIICNSVGLPDVAFCNTPGNRNSDHYSCMHKYRYVHLFLHALGLVLFTVLILPLTEKFSADSIYWK